MLASFWPVRTFFLCVFSFSFRFGVDFYDRFRCGFCFRAVVIIVVRAFVKATIIGGFGVLFD